MLTKYEILTPGFEGITHFGEVDWPREPSFAQMRELIEPMIQSPEFQGKAYLEHVRVWHQGSYVSMFVDDSGTLKKLPVNEAATKIYHANMVSDATRRGYEEPNTSDWPKIHGPAVLFDRNVWA